MGLRKCFNICRLAEWRANRAPSLDAHQLDGGARLYSRYKKTITPHTSVRVRHARTHYLEHTLTLLTEYLGYEALRAAA